MPQATRVLLGNLDQPLQIAIRTLLATTADLLPVDETIDWANAPRRQDDNDTHTVMLLLWGEAIWDTIAILRSDFPQLRLVLIAEGERDCQAPLLAELGIAGCLMKHELAESLVHAIRAVAGGESWFGCSVVAQPLVPVEQPSYPSPITALTAREWQVLALIAQGLDNA